jgi:hypothetical protein
MATKVDVTKPKQLSVIERIYNRGINEIEEAFAEKDLWHHKIPKRSFYGFLMHPSKGLVIDSNNQYKFGY